ncbi:MAG: CDP-diacylglycerol--serine O-phosphatidyltransferase [Candidatus Omnitrophota bacterium]
MNFLANLVTSLNLLSGFLAIIFSLESCFTLAGWAILLSLVLDGIDGQIARLNPVPSPFGNQLDSLVDVVSFGIAPLILVFVFLYVDLQLKVIPLLFLYLICGIIRLAKYNLLPKEKTANSFLGLPITISGGLIASFILFSSRLKMPVTCILTILVVLISLVMVLFRVRYPNLNGIIQLFNYNKPIFIAIILISLTVLLIYFIFSSLFFPEAVILAFLLIYLIFSPFMLKLLPSEG